MTTMIQSSWWLLWAHVMLVWGVAHYLILDQRLLRSRTDSPLRTVSWSVVAWPAALSVAATVTILVLSVDWLLVVLFVVASLAMTVTRTVRPAWRLWERELLLTVGFALASAIAIERASLPLRNPVLALPTSDERIAVFCLVGALLLYTIHGGTYIVRGILEASGVPSASGRAPDATELRRGLWIGGLERALLFVVVVAGSYEALGFVMAAKGLIRSRDLEVNRDLTEYFLIGSLASVAVALGTGIAARSVIQALWR